MHDGEKKSDTISAKSQLRENSQLVKCRIINVKLVSCVAFLFRLLFAVDFRNDLLC